MANRHVGGMPAYLIVEDWHRKKTTVCFSIETATLFSSREQAKEFADAHPKASEGHEPAEVLPVWELTQRTLADPSTLKNVALPKHNIPFPSRFR